MMDRRVKVVIFGDTLLLASLQASLAIYAGLDVFCVEEVLTGEELQSLQPDVVIVDTSSINPAVFRLVTGTPAGLRIFGVDAAENRVLVWSGQMRSASSMRDLIDLIGHFSPNSP